MHISRCTRCDQLIEYDASYEGEEVLCPACDNITRLQEIPPDELPDLEPADDAEDAPDEGKASRAPLRIAADAIPKPEHDPAAPLKADENDGLRGPDKVENEPAPIDRDAPISQKADKGDKKSKLLNNGKAVELPAGATPEIKILEGADSVAFFGEASSSDDGTITIPAKVAIPIVILLALGVLAVKFWPEKDHQAEGRKMTMELRAQIEARMAEIRSSVQVELEEPNMDAMPASSASPPSPTLAELMRQNRETQRTFVGTNVVTVKFPAVPTTIKRSVDRYEDQAFQTYVETALKLPYRLFDDTVIDLRTLAFAMRRGMTDFDDNWKLLGGVVAGREDDGLLLRLDRRYYGSSRIVLIAGLPESLGFVENLPLGVMGRKTSPDRELAIDDGEKRMVEVFEFGVLPSQMMIEVVQEKALEREKYARHQITATERRKAEKAESDEKAKRRANDERAVAYLRKRIKAGSASAEFSLGVRYLEGAGVPKNREEGLRLIRKAAKANVYAAKKKLKELGE